MIHDIFHVSLLEQDITRKGRVDKKIMELEFEANNSKEYKLEAIWNSVVYANKAKGHLPSLYYLVAWKRYLEKENTWEPSLAVQHLKKPINSFHKKHLEKPTATSSPINSAPPMARLTVKLTSSITKRKRGRLANRANKQASNWVLNVCNIWAIPPFKKPLSWPTAE